MAGATRVPRPCSLRAAPGPTQRRVILNGGFIAAAAAAVLAVSKERQLRLSRGRLLDLPAGADDEWTLEFEHAERLQRTRNLWLGTAIGAGGVTLAYMLMTSAAGDESRANRVSVPLPGEWSLRLNANPAAPGISLAGAF